MKNVLVLVFFITVEMNSTVNAQSQELQQLLLNIEKLAQFKQILSDLKKGYQILSTGYVTIKDLSEGNLRLHKGYLDGLMAVSPIVRRYWKVTEIINDQIQLVNEYKDAFGRFKRDPNFSRGELEYMSKVYADLFGRSIHNIEDLTGVITAGKLRMSDDERLAAVDRVYIDMRDKLIFVRYFNNSTTILALQRARERNDVHRIAKIYGLVN